MSFKVKAVISGGIAKVYEYRPSDSTVQATSALYYDYNDISTTMELKLNIFETMAIVCIIFYFGSVFILW